MLFSGGSRFGPGGSLAGIGPLPRVILGEVVFKKSAV
jgi:hypothetical protein